MRLQKCEAIRVVDGTNWNNFYWPDEVNKLDEGVKDMLQKLDLMRYREIFQKQRLSLAEIAEMGRDGLKYIKVKLYKDQTAIIKYLSEKYPTERSDRSGGKVSWLMESRGRLLSGAISVVGLVTVLLITILTIRSTWTNNSLGRATQALVL